MLYAIIIPLFIGTIGILQGAINRVIATQNNLTQTIMFSLIVSTLISISIYLLVKYLPPSYVPAVLQIKATSFKVIKWWYILPGIFGIFIVFGIPWSISEFGALKTTVGLVAAQMITSLLWDTTVEKLPITNLKLLGIMFGGLSTLLVTWGK